MICDEGAGARYSLFSGKAKKKFKKITEKIKEITHFLRIKT